MATLRFRNSRRRQRARRTRPRRDRVRFAISPHQNAIRRLTMEIGAHEQLMGLFHGGVSWRALACLLDPGRPVTIETEKALLLEGRRFVPDLIVRCAKTYKILLVVEVWHTHPVSKRKKGGQDQILHISASKLSLKAAFAA
jgi:hypothetical protein